MGTKNNPSKFDCYSKAEPDEPMFVLLARDHFAPIVIDIWVHMIMMHNEAIGEPGMNEKLIEATEVSMNMRKWKKEKDNPNSEDELEELRKTVTDYRILLGALKSWAASDKTMPANEFAKWLLSNRDTLDIESFGVLDSNIECLCGHKLIEHNILQDFTYQAGAKMGPAQAPEYRHCKECKCPKFQKPNM